ncbi:MAG: hypothetical protein PQJ46_07570 [Spirochaetales bacterium]|nr:hypothetical protein [Spirochaetales bacterium]
MNNILISIEEANDLIDSGKNLLFAGYENVLKQLHKGSWIGGTTPYFVAQNGGELNTEKVFVTEIPDYISNIDIQMMDEENISSIFTQAPKIGFVVLILPTGSNVHLKYALEAPEFQDFATRPIMGWTSAVAADELGKINAKVINGLDCKLVDNKAVIMNITLPEGMYADLGIVNIFEQGDGTVFKFEEDGFSAKNVIVDGKKVNMANYMRENKIGTAMPLVADYYGASINVTLKDIGKEQVTFYAPVFKGIEYRIAKPINNYEEEFKKQIPETMNNIFYSCNCFMNYVLGNLEGKKTANITGMITFGEIAYQLLNQTLVYLSIKSST